jgi:hypothetical protein
MFFIIFYIYIIAKLNSLYLSYTKKRNFEQIYKIRFVRIFVFLLVFHYYEFYLETIYIYEVGSQEHL